MPISHDQMEPHPLPEDVGLRRPDGPGHGAGIMGRPPRRGIVVTVRRLKKGGVNLSVAERRKEPVIVGELKIRRVQDRGLEFQSLAELISFQESLSAHLRFHPIRLLALLNPEIVLVDERGMILYGIERIGGGEGPAVAYWQTWQVAFGKADPGPAF